jgi:hypothetical protein
MRRSRRNLDRLEAIIQLRRYEQYHQQFVKTEGRPLRARVVGSPGERKSVQIECRATEEGIRAALEFERLLRNEEDFFE